MLLSLISVTVTLWVSQAHGQETTCDPPTIANGLYVPNETTYRLEDVVTYRCDSGFSPLSQGNKTRCTDGGWKPLPRCVLESCEFPEIKHGVLYREDVYRTHFPTAVGQWYYYTCDDYYVNPLTQLNWDRITCTPEGWSPTVPCLRKCVFNYLEHGYSPPDGQTYLQGQSASVTCHPDYSLPNRQTTMTCTENGWSPPPRCIKKKAPPRYNLFMIF
ncbi:complement factor H-like isoform X1 [Sturnira hondurensis]|uniref:complement factor H-like isoform X1 n=1 Tax=Sturnira hondurensis TaxID=192404 RepID=UPI00187AA7C6|nr:complement factor H-like isoform X1 [Sturnira hondurensis]